MTVLTRLTCTTIGSLLILIGFPGLIQAQERCIITSAAEFPGYVSQLSDGINKKAGYLYGRGDRETPENAFVSGAIAVRSADLFVAVQFDRSGAVTDFDVQRMSDAPVDEVLVYLRDDCLESFQEDLAALAAPIEKQVKFQLEREEERKAKLAP